MDNEDKALLRGFRNWCFGIIIGLMLLGGAATVVSRAFDLAWFPWEVQMKTQMIRNSNSYVTTQQTQLRILQKNYLDATTDAQKQAIIEQMREAADLIPNDVQPDIQAFLAAHGRG